MVRRKKKNGKISPSTNLITSLTYEYIAQRMEKKKNKSEHYRKVMRAYIRDTTRDLLPTQQFANGNLLVIRKNLLVISQYFTVIFCTYRFATRIYLKNYPASNNTYVTSQKIYVRTYLLFFLAIVYEGRRVWIKLVRFAKHRLVGSEIENPSHYYHFLQNIVTYPTQSFIESKLLLRQILYWHLRRSKSLNDFMACTKKRLRSSKFLYVFGFFQHSKFIGEKFVLENGKKFQRGWFLEKMGEKFLGNFWRENKGKKKFLEQLFEREWGKKNFSTLDCRETRKKKFSGLMFDEKKTFSRQFFDRKLETQFIPGNFSKKREKKNFPSYLFWENGEKNFFWAISGEETRKKNSSEQFSKRKLGEKFPLYNLMRGNGEKIFSEQFFERK